MPYVLFFILFICVSAQTVILGIAPKYSKEVELTRFKKIARYIESKTKLKIELSIPDNYALFIEKNINNEYAIAYSAPIIYTKSRLKNSDLVPMVSVTNGGKTTFQTYFITLKNSPISSIQDIKGKRIAFGHEKSSTRYLIPSYTLNQLNIKFSDFSSIAYHQEIDESMINLLTKTVDVVAVHEAVYKNYKDDVKIIYKSLKFPEYTISANKSILSKEQITLITNVFLNADKSLARSISYRYDGFSKAHIQNYHHVQNVAKYHVIQKK
jgi:phosphonate transport system substrate-binding protein